MFDNINQEARTWGMWCHLASLLGIPLALLSFIGIPPLPFANILGPLVVWLWKKKEHPFIDDQGKESLNFQISLTIYGIVIGIIAVVVGIIVGIIVGSTASSGGNPDRVGGALIVGFGLAAGIIGIALTLIGLVALALVIFAAIKAKGGQYYPYPLTIRLIK
jgi:uncharacterized Tic20 family protein